MAAAAVPRRSGPPWRNWLGLLLCLCLAALMSCVRADPGMSSPFSSRLSSKVRRGLRELEVHEDLFDMDEEALRAELRRLVVDIARVHGNLSEGFDPDAWTLGRGRRLEATKFDIASCVYSLQGTIRDDQQRNPYKIWTCPWYHLKWPANRQDKWTKCTGIGKYVKYHEDVNLGLFITDRVINPIGGYTECLLTALNAAASKWCNTKADEKGLSTGEIWEMLYGEPVERVPVPDSNLVGRVIKLLREKLYAGLKFFGEKLGIGPAKSMADTMAPVVRSAYRTQQIVDEWCATQSNVVKYFNYYQTVKSILGYAFAPFKFYFPTFILEPECEYWNMKAMEWEASGFSSEFFKNPSCGTTRRLEDVMTPVFTNASAKATTTRRVLVTDAEVEARVGQLIEDKVAPLNTFISFAQFLKDAEEELKDVWEKTAEPVVSVVADVVDTFQDVIALIGGVFQGLFGDIIDVFGTILDKVADLLCFSLEDGPPKDCGFISLIISVVEAIIKAIVSALDIFLDWVVGLIKEAIFKAIPEIQSLFRVLDFSAVTNFFKSIKDGVRLKLVDFANTMKAELGINKLYTVPELDAYLRANVWADPSRKFITQDAKVSGSPVLTFTCEPGFYPVVEHAFFNSDICEKKDYGRYIRFPCKEKSATPNTCNVPLEPIISGCLASPPLSPEQQLFAPNVERYFAKATYTCYDQNQKISVVGELESYPIKSQAQTLELIAGEQLEFTYWITSYPGSIEVNRNDQVIYIAATRGTRENPCFNPTWAASGADSLFRKFLCSYIESTGIEPTGTAVGSTWTESVDQYRSAFPGYYQRNTCQSYWFWDNGPVAGIVPPNRNFSLACYEGNGGIEAAANGLKTFEDCRGIAIDVNPYLWYRTTQFYAYEDTEKWSLPQAVYYPVYQGDPLHAAYFDVLAHCCAVVGCLKCGISFVPPEYNLCGVLDARNPDLAVQISAAYTPRSPQGRQNELQGKFAAFSSWMANSPLQGDCVARLQSCTGKKTCDLTGCKIQRLDHIKTNKLQPALNNTEVVFAFYGGGIKFDEDNNYEERLRCDNDMTPVIISLDAGWAPDTGYKFDLATDMPVKMDEATSKPYYSLRPKTLRDKMLANNNVTADDIITFRAEYVCNCPVGYELRSGRFNDITSCTRCSPGTIRARVSDVACTPCPRGTYEVSRTSCALCPGGTYGAVAGGNGTEEACAPCPPLTVSSPGATGCYLCSSVKNNTYGLPSRTECADCPIGTYFPTTLPNDNSTLSISGCLPCPDGYYRNADMLECAKAPPGYYVTDSLNNTQNATQQATRHRYLASMTDLSLERRALIYSVDKLRRALAEAEDTRNRSSGPLPRYLLPCQPGTFSTGLTGTSCPPCTPGSYQPLYHQDRCIPCDVGLTTLRFGSTSEDECVVPPPPPVEPDYPTHLTCAQLLMEYRNSTLELQFVGDGLCNPGILNTPNCDYDGGDCCPQTCRPGKLLLSDAGTLDVDLYSNYTTDPAVIEWLQNATVPTLAVNYSYTCAAGTFACKDPSVVNRPLNCTAFEAPTEDTFLNASCGLYNFDPRYGDGFCDAALNFKECNYDGGDCCEPTCKFNPFVPGGCAPASLRTCRDPLAGDWGQAYINPPVAYAECRPFFFGSGLNDLRVRTKVTAGITPCAQRQVNVTEARATIERRPECLGNFTYTRNWRITEISTGLVRGHGQDVYISNTLPPPYTPRPTCLWRPRIFNTTAAGQYSLGLLSSSPFFNFNKADICSVRLGVTFLGCTNVGATAGNSSGRCLYDAATDKLSLSSLEDGDLWNVTVRLTDSCSNTNEVWSPLLVSFTDDPEAPDSVSLNGIEYPCIDTTYCPNRVVDARQPSPNNKLANITAQVCTATEFQPISSSFVRLCVMATRNRPECADSASSGRLRALFLNSNDLGLTDPGAVSVINGSLKFGNSCLPALPGEGVDSCGGWGVQQDANRSYNIGWEVDGAAFAGLENGNADLGCIFLEASNWTAPPTGMQVGLAFSDAGGDGSATTSIMVGRVCIPRPPPLPVPNTGRNVIATRLPSDSGDGPPVCVRVSPPGNSGASTTRICLAVTNQYPGCASSATSGRLDYILLDSTRIGILDPDQLSFESGWVPTGGAGIHVTRPYCSRSSTNITTPPPLDCLTPQGIPQPPRIRGNLLTVAIPVDDVTWQSPEQELGCLYVTSPDLYALNRSLAVDRFKDWAFAFHFSEVPAISGSGADTTSYMGGAAFFDPVDPSAPSTARDCPRNAVAVRVPLGDNGASTNQVCTLTDVTSVDLYTLEVCLSVHDTLPSCGTSSLQGRLQSVFMDSRGFGVSDPGDISIEDGTIELERPYCRGEGLQACRGQNVSGVASPVGLPSFNQAFTVRNTVAWTGTRRAVLGCFYVKRVDGLQFSPPAPPGSGWSMAFTYNETEGGRRAVSAAKLCRSDPPVLTPANAERTVISTRLPIDPGDAPLVCVAVRPPVAVDRSTTAVCLATTTEYPGCTSSATSGRLDWVMLDTTRLGVTDPAWLNFESGPLRPGEGIQLASPYCSRFPTNATNPPPLACLTPPGIPQPPRIRGNLLTAALPITDVTWQAANSELGCLYVTSPNMYPDGEEVPPTRFKDWAFAFHFSEVTLTSSSRRRRALATAANAGGTTYVGGVSFYEPVPSNASSTATLCANNAVTLRVPQGDNQGSTSQVCTATNITSIDPFTLQVCLSVDDTLPGCVSSSLQGRLRGVFLDSHAFGGVAPEQLSLEDGSVRLQRPYCKGEGLLACQGQSVGGVAWSNETRFNMAFAVANDVAWTGTRRALLGCFFVKQVDGVAFTPPGGGWSVGVTYSDTEQGRRAISAARLCLPPAPPLLSVSTASQPTTKWWASLRNDSVCPAATMVVDKAVPKLGVAHGDPDKMYKSFQSVCTRVDVARVDHRKFEICLSVPAGARGRCKGTIVNGTLAAVYFNSAVFGAPSVSALTVENGTIQVATPICTSPNGQSKQGRVERCGAPYTQLHLKGRKKYVVLDVGLEVVASIPISSSRYTDRPIGCFYVTGPPSFSPAALLPKGWSMALRFNGKPTASGAPNKGRGPIKTKKYTYSITAENLCRKGS